MMTINHRIASGAARLAVQRLGSGVSVIFLHANVCDSRMWRASMHDIGRTNQAIAYDRRGFGETRTEAEDFSAVADLMAVADELAGDQPVVLVGCSQGGRIALDAALRHPTRIGALVLIAPTVSGAPEATYSREIAPAMERLKAAERAGDLDLISTMKARLFLDGPLSPEGRVSGEARHLFLDMMRIAQRLPPTGLSQDREVAFSRLNEIRAPSLIIYGDLDFPHVQHRSRQAAAAMPHAHCHEMTGVAHLPSLEQPEMTTALIARFIDNCRHGLA